MKMAPAAPGQMQTKCSIINHQSSISNQLNQLNQGDGRFEETLILNNDGLIDIVIGNQAANQLLLNQGGGTFQEIEDAIPGDYDTQSLAVGNVNGDGLIDILVGNYWDPNQFCFLRKSQCLAQ